MPYIAARGHTLLIPSGTQIDPDKKHLFYVVTDLCADGEHLLIPMSSIKPKIFHDTTCIIKAGEHPFASVDSFAFYRMARTTKGNLITKCVEGWVYMKKEEATEALIHRVCEGVPVSDFTPKRIVDYYEKNKPKPRDAKSAS